MGNASLVAVVGIGGVQNRAIAAEFLNRGFRVRGISRQDFGSAPPTENIEYRRADPANFDELGIALEGAKIVVLSTPIDHRPGVRERLVASVAKAASSAGADRIVFNAAAAVYKDRAHPVAKILGALSDTILAGPVPANVLQPTVYMDNLLAPWSLPGIANDGVLAYPMPEDAPVSWISHRSLGEFVHAAATKPLAGRVFEIGGPQAVTGRQVASLLAASIGRKIVYSRIPLPAFAQAINAAFGAPAGDDIAALYATMEKEPEIMRRDPESWKELGVQPETFESWLRRQSWPKSSA